MIISKYKITSDGLVKGFGWTIEQVQQEAEVEERHSSVMTKQPIAGRLMPASLAAELAGDEDTE